MLGIALGTAVAGLWLCGALGPAETFWTVDDAGKYLVLQELAEDPADPALEHPGRALDPEQELFPQPLRRPEAYAVQRGGQVYSQYAAPFVYLAWCTHALPWPGNVATLPALGAAGSVLAAAALARRLSQATGAGRAAAAILVLASPLLFYAAVFWEHTCTMALAGGALALLAASPNPARALGAGLLFGAACLLREEVGLLVAAAVAVAVLERWPAKTLVPLAAGGALGLGLRALFDWATGGGGPAVHTTLNRPEPFVHSVDALRGLLLGTGFSGVPFAVAVLALLVLASARALLARWSRTATVTASVLVAAIGVLGWARFPGGQDSALALIRSNSALLFVPWALVAPLIPARDDAAAERRPARIALLFLAAFLVLVPERSITGVHPGPRMLLPLLPLAAAITAARLVNGGALRWLLLPLLLVAAAWNARSLVLLSEKRHLAGDLLAALRDRPESVVATDLFWLPTEMAALWDEKQWFLLRGDADLARLAARARAAGEHAILAPVAAEKLDQAPVAAIHHDAFSDFSVDLHVLELPASPTGPETAP